MRLTICGSVAEYDRLDRVRVALEAAGHEVWLPLAVVLDGDGRPMPVGSYYELRQGITDPNHWVWHRKSEAMQEHYGKIGWADAIVVVNYPRRGINHYIGGNTLIEMGLAHFLDRPIYLLYGIPDLSYREEIIGCQPILLDGDLSRIPSERNAASL